MDNGVNPDDARQALDHVNVLRHRRDLDLLIFFARHPRTLLTSEQIAAFLGYEVIQIADSLDLLLAAGLLTRTQHPSHAARLYVLAAPAPDSGGWLPRLVGLASSRGGRLALLAELTRRQSSADTLATPNGSRTLSRQRPVLVRGNPVPGAKAG